MWYGLWPYRTLRHLPGPRPLPFIGNLKDLKKGQPFLVHREFLKRYGDGTRFCNSPLIKFLFLFYVLDPLVCVITPIFIMNLDFSCLLPVFSICKKIPIVTNS